jgi:hypothetical protein
MNLTDCLEHDPDDQDDQDQPEHEEWRENDDARRFREYQSDNDRPY